MRRTLIAIVLAAALPAAAQSVPAANYTDMWWNPSESGWGISFAQHSGGGQSNQVLAVWYTYDPRDPDTSTGATTDFKPLWLVMPGGVWSTPTSITGDVYVTNGTPFAQSWNNSSLGVQKVGTFTFTFSSTASGTFSYNIAPPAGLASTNPAFGLPALTGAKSIQRQTF